MSYECLYRATIGLIENERGSLDRVPSIVRRASSATPVPVVNETLSLLLSGLRLSFKGSSFFGSFGQGDLSLVFSRCCSSRFRLKGRLTFPFREVFVPGPLLSQWTDS